MNHSVLVTFATKHGGTGEIAVAIAEALRKHGLAVEVSPVEAADDVAAYDAVVLGSAVYVGQWRKEAVRFLEDNETALAGKPLWLFSSGPTGEGDPVELLKGWRFPDGQRELVERLRPQGIIVFHGVLEPESLSFLERVVVKNVKAPVGDFRDWEAIHEWAGEIAATLASDE
jgi:menaquinone-dependent protoporphyrinogen oxidase